MNRNMMIGGVVAIVVVIILVVVFVMGGDDEEENGDGGVTAESITAAWEAILAGDPEPAKALSCEEDHANIEAAAEAMSVAAGVEGADPSVSCEVDGDTITCDLTIAGETTPITSEIVDGLVCGGTQPGG
jgi:hypothetical protein